MVVSPAGLRVGDRISECGRGVSPGHQSQDRSPTALFRCLVGVAPGTLMALRAPDSQLGGDRGVYGGCYRCGPGRRRRRCAVGASGVSRGSGLSRRTPTGRPWS